nr:hypothetical protein [Catellatospora sp. TT07R-123]
MESGLREVTPALVALYERVTGRVIEASPDDLSSLNVDDVHRRDAFRLAGATLAGSFGDGEEARVNDDAVACAQWLSWELWHRDRVDLHESEIPTELRAGAAQLLRELQIIRSGTGEVRFAHAGLIDFHIAARVYAGIAVSNPALLATAQTSHATDQVIRQFVEQDGSSARSLSAWMTSGSSPVLRVNAAGILAKVPSPTLADGVITALRADRPARQLYVTAVAHRVLGIPWSAALSLTDRHAHGTTPELYAGQLAAELRNPRDAAARWCSAVLLHDLGLAGHEPVRAAVVSALHTESARENLRTMAALLAGVSPVNP